VSQAEQDRLLAWAARRARGRDTFIASDLFAYQERHRLDDAELAAWLRCSTRVLTDLALCRRPPADAPSFRQDVDQIANYVGVRSDRLALLLRETDAIAALRAAQTDQSARADRKLSSPVRHLAVISFV
jgi:hypothetical protein